MRVSGAVGRVTIFIKFLFFIISVFIIYFALNPFLLDRSFGDDVRATSIKISFSGDILPHKSLYNKAKTKDGYNFDFAFKDIKSSLVGDLNLCHMEVPVVRDKPSSYPVFGAPLQILSAIKAAGWQGCSFASNHSLDRGVSGINLGIEEAGRVGLGVSGIKREKSDLGYMIYEVKGVKVAYLAYTYGSNGIKPPGNKSYVLNYIDREKIIADINVAHKQSDIVIVYLHFGDEYREAPSKAQRDIVNFLISTGKVSGIVGSHTHVIQPFQVVKGVPVIFGMGNLWSGQGAWSGYPRGGVGGIYFLNFAFKDGRYIFDGFSATPTYVESGSLVIEKAVTTNRNEGSNCLSLKEFKRVYKLDSIKTCG